MKKNVALSLEKKVNLFIYRIVYVISDDVFCNV